MEKLSVASKTTFITLAAAVVGFIAHHYHFGYSFVMIPIIIVPKYYPVFGQTWKIVAQLTLTTFVFGLISSYGVTELSNYF